MLYLFYGDDQFSLSEEIAQLKTKNIPAETIDFNYVKLDAERGNFSLEAVLQNADAFPFLSDKRMVVVVGLSGKLGKSADAMPARGRGKAAKSETKALSPRERLLDFLTHVPDSVILVLMENKIGKNEVLFKTVSTHGQVKEFQPPTGLHLEKWVTDRARKLKIKLENNVAEHLARYIGPDLYRLDNELQKLAAYAGENEVVTVAMVEQMTAEAHTTSIFDLTDALGRRNFNRAVQLLNQLRDETNLNRQGFTRQLFATMNKQIYDLCRIRELVGQRKSQGEIASTLGIHPFVVQKNMEMVRNFESNRLDYLYHRLTELDYADKTGRGDLTIQLDLLVAEICQK